MNKTACLDAYVVKKRDLKNNYYSLRFTKYPLAKSCRPGQFIQMQLPHADIFFRRPMSIAAVDATSGELEVIFKVVGKGTALMSSLENDKVNILGPLGNAFSLPKKNETVIIAGGGVGFPPLLFFAEYLIGRGVDPKKIEFFYGGRDKEDILDKSRIKQLGVNFNPVTENGSYGTKGLITGPIESFLKHNATIKMRMYACGPEGMLKAIDTLGQAYHVPGELSLEAPMPCGVGICLGCVVPLVKGGHARVCVEGPVFQIGEVAL